MKIGTGVVIASACVLAGCAGFVPTSGGGSGQDDCDSNGVCHVTISVTMCHFITARPDPVTIGYRRPNMNIHWEYTQTDNGVRMQWTQDFHMKDGAPLDDTGMTDRINGNTVVQMNLIKEKLEAAARAAHAS